MKKFFSEFKEFISKGNVIDLAVGIIIGSAFTGIVNSLVNQVIMPSISFVTGRINFTDLKLPQNAVGKEPAIFYGAFIQQVINFLIVAFVVFCMVKAINKLKRLKVQEETKKEEVKTPSDIELLTEIRDLLRENKK